MDSKTRRQRRHIPASMGQPFLQAVTPRRAAALTPKGVLPGMITLLAALGAGAQPPSPEALAAERSDGIWKAAVPAARMHSEFDGLDPIGLAAGKRIAADCSINWVNPDDGARYCFSSGTSLEIFLDSPQAHIASARAGWKRLTSAGS
jgi:hypothetical protein